MYIVGIDGGGTKTHCIIGDENGNLLSEGFSGPSNYQVAGEKTTELSIRKSLNEAMRKLEIYIDNITYAVLGLSGADQQCDFDILNKLCKKIFGRVEFKILNDCWIGLRADNSQNWGVVTICGTGGAAAGRTEDGKEVILRNLSYEFGNRGGGDELVVKALHYAFRSEELTGYKTQLEKEIPKLFGLSMMSGVDKILRVEGISESIKFETPIIISDLAYKGDKICQDILIDMGKALGQIAGGVIKKLKIQKNRVPIILVGSLFKSYNPLLLDAYTMSIHKVAPLAYIKVASARPVMGAYYLALEQILK